MGHTKTTTRRSPSPGAPRWLSPEEMRAWRGWIEATSGIADRIARDLRVDSDLSMDDYEVLVRLSEAPDHGMRMSDLAEQAMNSPSRLSQRVDRMASRGLVRRQRCVEDGRGWFAVMTPEGVELLQDAAPRHVASVRRHLFDRLTPEDVTVLSELMPRLAASGDAAHDE